ncbi:isoamylase early set domain-containing protein [Salinimonas chungwhensis]|uniref:isoamylase early set domain-containing protein n=1 Tax=Salinimonas chungwhensis TaxID=265425 RepID=UPI0003731136|nr:isoamylase early set domain-containing protein [Salinimonas chungwhensis]
MGLKKQYLKSKPVCKVTFRLTAAESGFAESVQLVGDFNQWDQTVPPMRRLKNGSFTQTLNLEKDQRYAFRYLIDANRWENDWQADAYLASGMGSEENSIVVV